MRYADLAGQVRAGGISAEAAADRLLAALTDAELLGLLDGDVPVRAVARLPAMIRRGPVPAGAVPRLGIPGIRFSDGPRGVVMGRSTAFPVTMARAATWDPALEEEVGLAMGREARQLGANYAGAVCVNLLRHPAWGRAQECYGEDPVLTGRMGAALTRGLQRNVLACVKHFALNSIENNRFHVDVLVDEHALHEVYLPHFKAVLDAGAASVMTAYNRVNGRYCDQNRVLLTDILRDEWGWPGFVTSDWVWGTHDAVSSLEAGLDVEMPLRMHRARDLPAALRDGRVSRQTVLRSAGRILRTLLRHEARRDPVTAVPVSEHRALARRVAARGAVLLRNEQVLPLPRTIRRIAVLGPLAGRPNLGDRGSSRVRPPTTCSILEGLREALPDTEIVTDADAPGVEAAVVVVGLDHRDEGERIMSGDLGFLGFPFTLRPVRRLVGKLVELVAGLAEGGDRTRLTLADRDEELIRAVAARHPRTVVVLIGGSAVLMESWRARVPAILLAWYPGMAGGHAIADVLTGAAEPGGRLPVAIPTSAAHLPPFDATADRVVYDAWWGQRKLDRDGHPAAFPFGFGLGYTTWEMELLTEAGETATVRVVNTGARAGSTVVQVYAVDEAAERRVPQLVGFRRVELPAGAAATVEVPLDRTPTRERDPVTRAWGPRPGRWRLVAAPHSPG
jgi:beta-glucosidase